MLAFCWALLLHLSRCTLQSLLIHQVLLELRHELPLLFFFLISLQVHHFNRQVLVFLHLLSVVIAEYIHRLVVSIASHLGLFSHQIAHLLVSLHIGWFG